jgi:hypothetical protein
VQALRGASAITPVGRPHIVVVVPKSLRTRPCSTREDGTVGSFRSSDRRNPSPQCPNPTHHARRQYEAIVPAVRDRIVQAALKIVIEPVFEADFQPCSFGLRPKRSAHDALQVLIDEAWRGRRWVVETDIASCFEAIPHDRLMQTVEERICDRQVLKPLRAMLAAGVMDTGVVHRADTGTPQGGLCAAAHNPPYEQCWVMHSIRALTLVETVVVVEHCA